MPKATPRPNVEAALAGLKDFQRISVDYVFGRLYGENPTRRFLLADEVGLGKTLVARGVIAKAVDRLWETVERIDVIYICSNLDIARQNINRLQIPGLKKMELATRLTLLPQQICDLQASKVNFVSFTPGTSFEMRSSLGIVEERVLVYWLLKQAWDFGDGAGPYNVLQGRADRDRFREAVRSFDYDGCIDPSLAKAFVRDLKASDKQAKAEHRPTFRGRFQQLCEQFQYHAKYARTDDEKQGRTAFIADLRSLLAAACIKSLEPDLIILDEFQRFKHLLDDEDPAGQLARHLFEWQEARVLLLSATPYKMYTLQCEAAQDDHYADFVGTLRFLLNDEAALARCGGLLKDWRRLMYRLADGPCPEFVESKTRIEAELRRVMCRTERLAVTQDRTGMLKEVPAPPLALTPGDVKSYLDLQTVARALEQDGTVEYWKSAPYLLSFMDEYQLKHALRDQSGDPNVQPVLAERLADGGGLALSWHDIRRYNPVDFANARLRHLAADTVELNAWRMLWLPPSLPYYQLAAPFEDPGLRRFTKRLVFSGWQVVPKAVATLLSYEAERQMVRSFEPSAANSAEARRRRRPLLTFTRSEGRLTGMPVLGLLYPSIALAKCYDPLSSLGGEAGSPMPTCEAVVRQVAELLQPAVASLTAEAPTSGQYDESWYWAAPILLDLKSARQATVRWLQREDLATAWKGEQAGPEEDSAWQDHVEALQSLATEGASGLGRPPQDLTLVLAQIAIGGPAITALRALSRVTGGPLASGEVRLAAGQAAWGFRSLFNVPEVICLIRGMKDAEPYWQRVLEYCLAGCLQSVLDEYAHVLREALSVSQAAPAKAAMDIAAAMAGAISLRVATPRSDDIRVNPQTREITIEQQQARARFAMRFGAEQADDGSMTHRPDQVRWAFNSPFWPFVLVTTSVGQEGLDFHSYCHAVVHWNLPSNPVDFEQREGRVHRYKGHAIRRNVAAGYGGSLPLNGQGDPWDCLFQSAAAGEPDKQSDLVPYWVCPGEAKIERHVPALPLSREWSRLPALRGSLAMYRMVFGQPRQEDLVNYLLKQVPRERLVQEIDKLRIDLSPQPAVVAAGQVDESDEGVS